MMHAAADAQLAHRADDLDQQALHGLDAAEDLDLVDRLDRRDQRFQCHVQPPSNHVSETVTDR